MGAYEAYRIHYVNTALGTGSDDGSSWANAYRTYEAAGSFRSPLSRALVAASSGDEIWVAQGTYYPTSGTDRFVYIELKNGVKVYGGFSGIESSLSQRNIRSYPTILSGNIGDKAIRTDNSQQIVIAPTGASARLDGFIITDADGWSDGSGIFLSENANCSIANCIITNNSSTGNSGGGVYSMNNASKFINCVITGNSTALYGGGFYFNYTLAGEFAIDFENCVIAGNYVTDNPSSRGGGISTYVNNASTKLTLNLKNCTIVRNRSNGVGGGLALFQFSSLGVFANLYNTILWDNEAFSNGSEAYGYSNTTLNFGYSNIRGGWNGARVVATGSSYNFGGNIGSDNVADDPMFAISLEGTWTAAGTFNTVSGMTQLTVAANTFTAGELAGAYVCLDKDNTYRYYYILGNTANLINVVGNCAADAQISDTYRIVGASLKSKSRCIDAADGSIATSADLYGRSRYNNNDIPDTGSGSVSYADMGAVENR